MNNKKMLLILEQSNKKLEVLKNEDEYILEGIFTQFGVKNNNNRIYDEKEAMPYINKLQSLAENKKLLGELDHPKSFDISLKNASHIIESLIYDKDARAVYGKIRLLNTDAGKNAKALVDAGVPLHISSRAAGIVEANGHVKIENMFTYDLVATPGFPDAVLNRVNESYGISNDSNIQMFEINDIYNNIDNKNKENNNMEYLSSADFTDYMKIVSAEFEKVNESIKNFKLNENTGNVDLTEIYEKLKHIDNIIKHNDYIVENLTNVKDYSEHMLEGVYSKVSEINEKLYKIEDYLEYMSNEQKDINENNKAIIYKLNEKTDNIIRHNDYIVENSNVLSDRFKLMGDFLDETVETQNKINENMIKHSDHIVEGLNNNTNVKMENIEGYLKYMSEGIKNNEFVNNKKLHESSSLDENNKYKNNVISKLDSIFENAEIEIKNQLQESLKLDNKMAFLDVISKDKSNTFQYLNESVQNRIISAFNENTYNTTEDANKIWESVFIDNKTNVNKWLDEMPQKYEALWENLSIEAQTEIKNQASMRVLETKNQIDNFWATRKFTTPQAINENFKVEKDVNYSNDEYLSAVVQGFRNQFKK